MFRPVPTKIQVGYLKLKKGEKKFDAAKQVGKLIAAKAAEAKIGKIIFLYITTINFPLLCLYGLYSHG